MTRKLSQTPAVAGFIGSPVLRSIPTGTFDFEYSACNFTVASCGSCPEFEANAFGITSSASAYAYKWFWQNIFSLSNLTNSWSMSVI